METAQRSIQSVLDKYDLPDEVYSSLLTDLQALLLAQSTKTKTHELKLVDLSSDYILLQQEASSAQEAITNLGKLMLEKAIFNEGYLEDILKIQQERPHYYVIADGVAMPHTLSEKGALKAAIGIMTLKAGVYFGNEKVNLILLLCSPNH